MDSGDLKKAAMLVMLLLLVLTAPRWLNPENRQVSNYDAPWVYPGLDPTVVR
jgi:hypothetical protein